MGVCSVYYLLHGTYSELLSSQEDLVYCKLPPLVSSCSRKDQWGYKISVKILLDRDGDFRQKLIKINTEPYSYTAKRPYIQYNVQETYRNTGRQIFRHCIQH